MTSSTAGRGRPYAYAIFAVGLAVHLLFLISLRTHWCDPLFLETGGIHGQMGKVGEHCALRSPSSTP